LRRQRLHRKCVDLLAHALTERRVHELVPLDAIPALEFLRHDDGLEMLAVADHLDVLASESRLNALLHAFNGHHFNPATCSPTSASRAPSPTTRSSLPLPR